MITCHCFYLPLAYTWCGCICFQLTCGSWADLFNDHIMVMRHLNWYVAFIIILDYFCLYITVVLWHWIPDSGTGIGWLLIILCDLLITIFNCRTNDIVDRCAYCYYYRYSGFIINYDSTIVCFIVCLVNALSVCLVNALSVWYTCYLLWFYCDFWLCCAQLYAQVRCEWVKVPSLGYGILIM